ncbi:MAG: protein kinase [Polyangiaceae bacterium]
MTEDRDDLNLLTFDLDPDSDGDAKATAIVNLTDEPSTAERPAPRISPPAYNVSTSTPTAFTPHDGRDVGASAGPSSPRSPSLPPAVTPPRSAMIGSAAPPSQPPVSPMRAPMGTLPVVTAPPVPAAPSRPPPAKAPPVGVSVLTGSAMPEVPPAPATTPHDVNGAAQHPAPAAPPPQAHPATLMGFAPPAPSFGQAAPATGFTPPPPQVAPMPQGFTPAPPQAFPPAQAQGPSPPQGQRSQSPFHVVRSRAYSFVLDARGMPIELGSGRFAKAYLGEERWLESKTDFRREVVIKILQKGVSDEDHMRFQMEKELLERVQGHPNVVELLASGEGDDSFVPPSIRDKVDPEFMILERLEMSLEERLKGSRSRGQKDDLLGANMAERVFRVLDYVIPIASAIEYAHLVRNICHRDLKPANVLIALPDPNLRGSALQVRLADFNVAKLNDEEVSFGMTQMRTAVPGTLFFQSPEQETNIIELLVNVQQGSPEVEFFEDFYIQIAKNDSFSLFNRGDQYPILYADRSRKRLVLGRPYKDVTESNVRARIQKAVGRPADIYSLGAMLYYLISGAYANPKTLYDAFHKFVEYEKAEETNTIEAYLQHEYGVIQSLRTPRQDGGEVAPADRFFSYKHYLDGNGDLIDGNVMLIIAKCMIRNKPDSYCQPHDLETRGISDLVADLIGLYSTYGMHAAARPTNLVARGNVKRNLLKMRLDRVGERFHRLWLAVRRLFSRSK